MTKQNLIILGLATICLVLGAIIILSPGNNFFVKDNSRTKDTKKSKEPKIESPGSKTEEDKFPSPTPLNIKSSEVVSITLNTSYEGFSEEDSKCRKVDDDSVCRVSISFNQDGKAVKSIEISRYNTAKKSEQVIEKSVWEAKISNKEFEDFANFIINEDFFRNWDDRVDLNVSNSSVLVKYKNGTRQLLSNVTEPSGDMFSMMEKFKQVKVQWKKIQ